MADARRSLLLLVNPGAGGKPASPSSSEPLLEPDKLRDLLAADGLGVTLHVLREGEDPGSIAAEAARDRRDVVVAGGDGTVRPAATALVGSDATLGVIPRGSWNNIATGWGLPTEEQDAAALVRRGSTQAVDVGLAWRVPAETSFAGREPPYDVPPPRDAAAFFEAAGVGLDAAGFGAASVGARYGTLRAVRAAWRALRRRRTSMLLTADGRRMRTSAPAVTACNGPYYGFGFALAPEADPRDGQLDLVIFSGMSTADVLRHYLAVARNRPRREPRVRRLRVRTVLVAGQRRPLPAHADGESIGMTPVAFTVRPAALRIFGGSG